ncbi:hypothetical protein B0H14DRAFT_3496789 [Mycena olivaceomarginata]|nr:hypothetical protein B0H14DRAFT_3496789 [Mycena olivaceomarginata]
MEACESPWSRIPPELTSDIARHNAHDADSLRAMCLASKAMRSAALEHLFSVIHFACAQDLSEWENILLRTPGLEIVVKKVKFSDPNLGSSHRRKLQSPQELRHAVVPPIFSSMANVLIVEWDAGKIDISMAVAHMALFPNMKELHLRRIEFPSFDELAMLLCACGKLRVLSLDYIRVVPHGKDRFKEHPPFDLTGLEELAVENCLDLGFVVSLTKVSQPTRLSSLTCHIWWTAIGSLEPVFRLVTPSLVNLELHLLSTCDLEITRLVDSVKRIPALPTLNMLSIPLYPGMREAVHVLGALEAAPNITKLVFPIMLYRQTADSACEYFLKIIYTVFPWAHPESMKNVLTRKFPLLQQIKFQMRVPRASTIHFRRRLRRRMERRLRSRLELIGADITEYLELGWFDEEWNPVTYSKSSGKPHWKLHTGIEESETEESDCDSELI